MYVDCSHIFIHPQVTTFDFYKCKDVPQTRQDLISFSDECHKQIESIVFLKSISKDVPQQTDDDLSTWLSWRAWDDVKALVIFMNNPWWFKDETAWSEPGCFLPLPLTQNHPKYLSQTVCHLLLSSSPFKTDLPCEVSGMSWESNKWIYYNIVIISHDSPAWSSSCKSTADVWLDHIKCLIVTFKNSHPQAEFLTNWKEQCLSLLWVLCDSVDYCSVIQNVLCIFYVCMFTLF